MANDQEIARLVIRLVAEVGDIKKGLAEVQSGLKSFSSNTEREVGKLSGAWAGLKNNWLAASAAIYAGWKTVQKAISVIEVGAHADAAKESFRLMTESMGVDGEKLIEGMKERGKVFVEETDLLVKAQRLLVEGITPDEIIKVMEAARVASRLMGIEVARAFDMISEALITLRTRGLKKAFPMEVSDVVKQLADKLKTVPELMNDTGKRAAILGEILKQAAEKGKLLGDSLASESSYEKIQKFRSTIAEIWEVIGIKLLPTIGLAASVFAQWASWIFYTAYGFDKLNEAYHRLDSKIPGFLKKTALYSKYTKEQNEAMLAEYASQAKANLKIAEDLQKSSTRAMQDSLDMIAELGKAPAAKAVFTVDDADLAKSMDTVGKNTMINVQELEEKVKKLKLDYAAKTSQALIEQATATVEKQKNESLRQAIEQGKDISIIEYNAAIEMSDKKLEAAKKAIKDEEVMTIEATYKELGRTKEVQGAIGAIKDYYRMKERIAVETNENEVGAIKLKKAQEIADAEFKAIQAERGMTPEMEPFAATATQLAEMDKRSQDYQVFRSKMTTEFRRQLIEITGTYDEMTQVQVDAIKNEQEEYRNTAEFWMLSLDQQEKYDALIETRISKLKEVRDAEKSKYIKDTHLQLSEIIDDYDAITRKQVDVVEAEREVALTTVEGRSNIELVNRLYDERVKKLKDVREAEKSKYTADLSLQLAEVSHQYDEITDRQVESIEAERKLVLTTVEGRSNVVAINKLYDERIEKLKEVRALEKGRDISDLRKQLAELMGDWQGIKQAEIECLDAELKIKLATADLTDMERELLVEINERRKAELQAAKDLDAVKLAMQGLRDFSLTMNQEMVDTFKNVLPDSIRAFGDEFNNWLETGKFNFENFAKSLQRIWNNVVTKMMEKQLTDLLTGLTTGGGISDLIKKAGSLIGLSTAAKPVVEGPMPTAKWVAKTGGGIIEEEAKAKTLAESITGTTSAMEGMDTELKKKPTDIAGTVQALTGMDGELRTAQDSLGDLTKDIPGMTDEFSSVVEDVDVPEEVFDDFDSLFASAGEGTVGLTEGFSGMFEEVGEGVTGLGGDFFSMFSDVGSGIGDLFGDLFSGLEIPSIFGFQEGGVATKKQLAWVAEKEPEVIIPKSKFTPETIMALIEGFAPASTKTADVFQGYDIEVAPLIEKHFSSNVGPFYVEGYEKKELKRLDDLIERAVVRVLKDFTR